MISICILKNCGNWILKPLELIFKSCIGNGKFPIKCKKANVVPFHKKITNSWQKTISLLPVSGKILERLIHNKKFEFFTENKYFTINQGWNQETNASINYYVSLTKFVTRWWPRDKRPLSWYIKGSKIVYQITF